MSGAKMFHAKSAESRSAAALERRGTDTFPLEYLRPSRVTTGGDAGARHLAPTGRGRVARSIFSTMPILLVGSIAIATMNLTGALDNPGSRRPHGGQKSDTSDLGKTIKEALARASAEARSDAEVNAGSIEAASVPSSYRVRGGDTVSSIAGRYGLSTAHVLAINGLSWKTVIFPGQVLRLSKAAKTSSASTSSSTRYTIRKGDTISGIAHRFGITANSLLTANDLKASSIIYAGRSLVIPRRTASTTPTAPPVVGSPSAPIAPPTAPSSYTIRSGDTITSIAKKFNVTVEAILTANHLTSSSIIYAGRTIVIPGISTASVGGQVVPLSPTMRTNARTIISVGRSLGVSDYGIVIALAAAAQESGLVNLTTGDKDSVGLFQQRSSMGWGTRAQLLTPSYATKLFFGGPHNPNKGKTRGLLDIAGWKSMSVSKAAQAVQVSAYPEKYGKWETSARAWLSELR